VTSRWLEGGTLPVAQLPDLYASRGVPELAERLEDRFPTIAEGGREFADQKSLTGYEVALARDRATAELKRLKTYPLSLAILFAYLLRAELERGDLRRIVFGRTYGIGAERLQPLLVSPRL
jgi:vacuolar-type H+-ATPase subunit C/Vma6